MKRITLVAALDDNRAIGFDNRMPWHLPDDLRRFKALTSGKTVLMGRKTAQSLGRALPNRQNLVLTRSGKVPFADMQAVATWQQAVDAAGSDELMVIGGGEIYAMALPMADCLHLTLVDTRLAQADAYFPAYDPEQWRVTHEEAHAADERHAFAFRFIDCQRQTR